MSSFVISSLNSPRNPPIPTLTYNPCHFFHLFFSLFLTSFYLRLAWFPFSRYSFALLVIRFPIPEASNILPVFSPLLFVSLPPPFLRCTEKEIEERKFTRLTFHAFQLFFSGAYLKGEKQLCPLSPPKKKNLLSTYFTSFKNTRLLWPLVHSVSFLANTN